MLLYTYGRGFRFQSTDCSGRTAPKPTLDPRVKVLQSETANPADRERAFAKIVDEFRGPLVGYVGARTGPHDDAEGLVQETFINAFRAMDRFENRGTAAFRKWLYKISRNLVLNTGRYNGSRPEMVAEGLEPSAAVSSASHLGNPVERLEFKEDLGVMDRLAVRQRTAMMLRSYDYSYEEIALRMDTTVPSVRSLLVRGRPGACA